MGTDLEKLQSISEVLTEMGGWDLSDLISQVKVAANGVDLLTKAWKGNGKAFSTLTKEYPKLASCLKDVKLSILNSNINGDGGNVFSNLNKGITAVRNNLTGLQKGATVAVAGIAEFAILSDTFKGLFDGSENLVAGIGKIGVAAAGAGLAMYTALGPAGVAIAAITALVAAIGGISETMETLRAEEIGNSIRNAMTNPGGTPLSEITSNFANAFSEAASGFSEITEKSAELKTVQGNIKDTWTEIEKIKTAIKEGVVSVEDGKKELERLFGELATLAENKFSVVASFLINVFGENGILTEAYSKLGIETDELINVVVSTEYKNGEEIRKKIAEMQGLNPESERYIQLSKDIFMLSGGMDEYTSLASKFAYEVDSIKDGIDYSEIYMEDGSIDTEKINNYLSTIKEAYNDYLEKLDKLEGETASYLASVINSPSISEEDSQIAEIARNYLPRAIKQLEIDAGLMLLSFSDALQTDFIGKTDEIIEEVQIQWREKNKGKKLESDTEGNASEAAYIERALNKHQDNSVVLSNVIKECIGDLVEVEGTVWVDEALDELFGLLISKNYIKNTNGRLRGVEYELNENYKTILDNATNELTNLMAQRGKDTVDGFNNEVNVNIPESEQIVKTWMERVREAIHNSALEFGSPSKATKQFGLDTIQGYNDGISENMARTMELIFYYMQMVQSSFSNVSSSLYNIGKNGIIEFLNGMSSVEAALYAKASSISANIAKAAQTILGIHSPSQVMFTLGEFTMEGFRLGIENCYDSIGFSMQRMDGSLKYNLDSASQMKYKFNYGEGSNNYDAAETNLLLRELIVAVKEGNVIEINGREIGRTVQSEDKLYYKRTGKGLFEH